MSDTFKPYKPGVIPTKNAPKQGESISLKVAGLPPFKDEHFSIRNSKHKIHNRFKILRSAAIKAMAGRAPYQGAIQLDITIYCSKLEKRKKLIDYLGGIEDTLDGSHGLTFTYLPIVYEDDCQVCAGRIHFTHSKKERYILIITFI